MSLGPPVIGGNLVYVPNPVHRNNTRGKSQWTINETQEVSSFNYSNNEGWIRETTGWGLHLVNGSPDYLGVARDHKTQVFVAKFVDANKSRTWHGYPTDFLDRPPEHILRGWKPLLRTRILKKLSLGQPCSL
ncbi:MAG TPA: hypothetical protein VFR24_18400 [Candidatus Angelobacter sp.]|nr:hypothetical protein [Candidatus Angelobacter sp.]